MISDQELLEAVAGAVGRGSTIAIPVSGRSMGAEFAKARNIFIQPFNPSAVRLGSVIVFARNGRWIVHRVMWKSGQGKNAFYITKGDNAGQMDHPYVPTSDVQGLVTGVEMPEGVTFNLASTRRRWVGLMIVARGWLSMGISRCCRSRPSSRG